MKKATDESISSESASKTDASITLRTDVNLSDDDLSKQAKEQFRGYDQTLQTQKLNARSILRNDILSPFGRHLVCMIIEKDYTNYKNVLNYVAGHPADRTNTPLKRDPLLLCGVPRAGTTLLYNLLACDPSCRAPFFANIAEPIPPLSRSETLKQIENNKTPKSYTDMFNALGLSEYGKDVNASHPSHSFEEDLFYLQHTGVNLLIYLLASHMDPELLRCWTNFDGKDFVYEYHKTFIQMFNSVDAPHSHWLLKAPVHTLYLDTLLRYYPDVSLVMSHRRLDEAIPSLIRLSLAWTRPFFDTDKFNNKVNKDAFIETVLYYLDILTRRLIEFRRANPNMVVFDIFYADLVAQPIDTVRRLYKHFGLQWSEEFELAMGIWLRENPQGSQGRNTYTLEEYGLDRKTIEKRYKDYYEMFLKAPNP